MARARGLVVGVELIAEGLARQVEDHRQVPRPLLAQELDTMLVKP